MNELANCEIEALRQGAEFTVARVARPNGLPSCLLVSPVLEQPAPSSLVKLENPFALREELDPSWAARPTELARYRGRLALVIEDPGGAFLDSTTDEPRTIRDFLRLAISIASSLAGLHGKGVVHKDLKPANVIANVAPEQTGRMNRSIDSRSDLYFLGVTFYELCVGELPFTAADPMGWVHCHIARLPVSPSVRRSDIPEPLSAIILNLLAKAPEERYQIVENHSGRLWVTEHDGPGASFHFTLPAHLAQGGLDVW